MASPLTLRAERVFQGEGTIADIDVLLYEAESESPAWQEYLDQRVALGGEPVPEEYIVQTLHQMHGRWSEESKAAQVQAAKKRGYAVGPPVGEGGGRVKYKEEDVTRKEFIKRHGVAPTADLPREYERTEVSRKKFIRDEDTQEFADFTKAREEAEAQALKDEAAERDAKLYAYAMKHQGFIPEKPPRGVVEPGWKPNPNHPDFGGSGYNEDRYIREHTSAFRASGGLAPLLRIPGAVEGALEEVGRTAMHAAVRYGERSWDDDVEPWDEEGPPSPPSVSQNEQLIRDALDGNLSLTPETYDQIEKDIEERFGNVDQALVNSGLLDANLAALDNFGTDFVDTIMIMWHLISEGLGFEDITEADAKQLKAARWEYMATQGPRGRQLGRGLVSGMIGGIGFFGDPRNWGKSFAARPWLTLLMWSPILKTGLRLAKSRGTISADQAAKIEGWLKATNAIEASIEAAKRLKKGYPSGQAARMGVDIGKTIGLSPEATSAFSRWWSDAAADGSLDIEYWKKGVTEGPVKLRLKVVQLFSEIERKIRRGEEVGGPRYEGDVPPPAAPGTPPPPSGEAIGIKPSDVIEGWEKPTPPPESGYGAGPSDVVEVRRYPPPTPRTAVERQLRKEFELAEAERGRLTPSERAKAKEAAEYQEAFEKEQIDPLTGVLREPSQEYGVWDLGRKPATDYGPSKSLTKSGRHRELTDTDLIRRDPQTGAIIEKRFPGEPEFFPRPTPAREPSTATPKGDLATLKERIRANLKEIDDIQKSIDARTEGGPLGPEPLTESIWESIQEAYRHIDRIEETNKVLLKQGEHLAERIKIREQEARVVEPKTKDPAKVKRAEKRKRDIEKDKPIKKGEPDPLGLEEPRQLETPEQRAERNQRRVDAGLESDPKLLHAGIPLPELLKELEPLLKRLGIVYEGAQGRKGAPHMYGFQGDGKGKLRKGDSFSVTTKRIEDLGVEGAFRQSHDAIIEAYKLAGKEAEAALTAALETGDTAAQADALVAYWKANPHKSTALEPMPSYTPVIGETLMGLRELNNMASVLAGNKPAAHIWVARTRGVESKNIPLFRELKKRFEEHPDFHIQKSELYITQKGQPGPQGRTWGERATEIREGKQKIYEDIDSSDAFVVGRDKASAIRLHELLDEYGKKAKAAETADHQQLQQWYLEGRRGPQPQGMTEIQYRATPEGKRLQQEMGDLLGIPEEAQRNFINPRFPNFDQIHSKARALQAGREKLNQDLSWEQNAVEWKNLPRANKIDYLVRSTIADHKLKYPRSAYTEPAVRAAVEAYWKATGEGRAAPPGTTTLYGGIPIEPLYQQSKKAYDYAVKKLFGEKVRPEDILEVEDLAIHDWVFGEKESVPVRVQNGKIYNTDQYRVLLDQLSDPTPQRIKIKDSTKLELDLQSKKDRLARLEAMDPPVSETILQTERGFIESAERRLKEFNEDPATWLDDTVGNIRIKAMKKALVDKIVDRGLMSRKDANAMMRRKGWDDAAAVAQYIVSKQWTSKIPEIFYKDPKVQGVMNEIIALIEKHYGNEGAADILKTNIPAGEIWSIIDRAIKPGEGLPARFAERIVANVFHDQSVHWLRNKDVRNQVIDKLSKLDPDVPVKEWNRLLNNMVEPALTEGVFEYQLELPNGKTISTMELIVDTVKELPAEIKKDIRAEVWMQIGYEVAADLQRRQLRQGLHKESSRFFNKEGGTQITDYVTNLVRGISDGEMMPQSIKRFAIADIIAELETNKNKYIEKISPYVHEYTGNELMVNKLIDALKKYGAPEGIIRNYVGRDVKAVNPGLNSTLKWHIETLNTAREANSMLWRIQTGIKAHLTALNPSAGITNAMANIFVQGQKRGKGPLGIIADLVDSGSIYKQYLEGKLPSHLTSLEPFLKELEASGLLNTTVVEAELGSLKNPAASYWGKAWRKLTAQKILTKAYRFGDNIFKLDQSLRGIVSLRNQLRHFKEGDFYMLDMTKNRKGLLVKTKEGWELRTPQGVKQLSEKDYARVIVDAANAMAQALFFDYSEASLYAQFLRNAPIIGTASPFYIWQWKAVDMPGKPGLLSAILPGGEEIAGYTNNKKVQAMQAKAAVKLSARRVMSINGMRNALMNKDRDEVAKLLTRIPGNMSPVLLQDITNPEYLQFNRWESINFGEPTLKILGIIQGLLVSATKPDLRTDAGLRELYPTLKEGGIDWNLKTLPEKERKRILAVRKMVLKNESNQYWSLADVTKLAGISGGPFVDFLEEVNIGERRLTDITLPEIYRDFGMVLFGGGIHKVVDIAIGHADPTSEWSTRRYAISDDSTDVEESTRWAIRKFTGRGWQKVDTKEKVNHYFKKVGTALRSSITTEMKNRSKKLETLGQGKEAKMYLEKAAMIDHIIKNELAAEKQRILEIIHHTGMSGEGSKK